MAEQLEHRRPKVVVAPEGDCLSNLTPGKEYNVTGIWSAWDIRRGYGFYILDDMGNECTCLEIWCAFLNGNSWIIKEYEE